MLNQIEIGKKDKLKSVYQININNYDVYGQHRFIYHTSFIEEDLKLKHYDYISIIDINVDFLREIDYTSIKGETKENLEKLLYLFICEDKEEAKEVYYGDRVMDKVLKKLDQLFNEKDGVLYYDKEALDKMALREEAEELAKDMANTKIKEIVKSMLKENIDIAIIAKTTGLTKEEIEAL